MKKLLTLAFGVITLVVLTGAALSGSTPWLDRDDPSGVGDYETTPELLTISCRFKATGAPITDGLAGHYHCTVKDGGWCKNAPDFQCQDMEVKYSWQ